MTCVFGKPAIRAGVVSATALLGCVGGQNRDSWSASGAELRRVLQVDGTGVQAPALVALPVHDTVMAAGPILLAYLVVNRQEALAFRNDPQFFTFEVLTPSGSRLDVVDEVEPPAYGGIVDLTLPAAGIIGRVVDLTCVQMPYAALPRSRCEFRYLFTEAGEHRIVVRYAPVPPPPEERRGWGGGTLESDTARFIVLQP